MDAALALQQADDDGELLRALVSTFLQDYPKVLAALRAALDARNLPAAQERAHSLKGSVGIFAAAGVCDAAQALEQSPAPANWPELEQHWEHLNRELDRLRPELSFLLTDTKAA